MAEPKLRFRQDDGSNYPAWKEMPLSALISDNLDPVPTPKEGYRRVGIYCHAKGTFQEDVSAEKVLDVDTMYRIHKDNLIVNITFAWEHAVAIVKPEDEGLLVSHRFPEYSFNDGQVPGFYKYLILRPYFRNQLSLASPGGAGRNRVLNKAQFKQIPVSVPCEAEQQKIADFLSAVDEVISTSEQEVANLEMQKKAVMKKIFSQEVRFKRDDGTAFPEWEEKKLGDVGSVLMCKRVFKEQTDGKGDIPFFKIGTFGGRPDAYISQELYNELKEKYSYPKKGNILLSAAGTIGRAVVYCGEPAYYQDSNIVWLDHDETLSDEYLLHFYSMTSWNNLEGGTVKRLYNGILLDKDISIPCLEEQHLIADFLSDFDEAIAAAKKELELWKELKKGLLQQMFV